jgi:hypothetical protein
MYTLDLQQLEMSIKQSQEIVDMGDSLERLMNNRDFKKVILDGYFKQEAIRLVHLKTDDNMQSDESQNSIERQMIGIGSVNGYLNTLRIRARMAANSLAADEETRNELLAEDL